MAAIIAAAAACAGPAAAAAGDGIDALASSRAPAPWISFVAGTTPLEPAGSWAATPGGEAVYATAGATIRDRSGWSASVFVGYLDRSRLADDAAARMVRSSTVHAQVSRRLSRTARVTFDVFNVFDQRVSGVDYLSASRLWGQPGTPENFLVNPAEPRGFRLRVVKTF